MQVFVEESGWEYVDKEALRREKKGGAAPEGLEMKEFTRRKFRGDEGYFSDA